MAAISICTNPHSIGSYIFNYTSYTIINHLKMKLNSLYHVTTHDNIIINPTVELVIVGDGELLFKLYNDIIDYYNGDRMYDIIDFYMVTWHLHYLIRSNDIQNIIVVKVDNYNIMRNLPHNEKTSICNI